TLLSPILRRPPATGRTSSGRCGCIGFLNDPFYELSDIASPASCQFLFCLMKNPLLYRSAWPESSRQASERFLMETLGRTQSERRRRLALAGGFRLLRSSGNR